MLCLPLFCSNIYGQTDFQPGYIIDNQGDTIRGLLKEQFAEVGYNVYFKKTETDDVEVKGINDIKKYYLGFGHLYETHELEHEGKPAILFLKSLVIGDVSLYSFTNDRLQVYYYVKTDELGFRELKYGKEIINSETSNSYVKTHNQYVGILKLVTQTCPDLAPRIDKLKFNERGVIDILKDYHYCVNRDFVEMTSTEKSKGKFGFNILAGPNYVITTEEGFPDYEGKIGLDVGASINYILPNSRGRYSTEIGYLSSNYTLRQLSTDETGRVRIDHVTFAMNTHFGSEKNRYNLKVGYYLAAYGPSFKVSSIVGGVGYDKKIGKIRLRTNLEYRFSRLSSLGLHIGIGL